MPTWQLGVSKDSLTYRHMKKTSYVSIGEKFGKWPELRYDINNGITLCHFHHPIVREEEKRLIPTYKELVSVSKDPFC